MNQPIYFAKMRLPKTLSVQIGRKLSGKSKDEIMKEVLRVFGAHGVIAVQLMYDTIRVTFKTVEGLDAAKRQDGVHLLGLWCRILGGGPPLTMVHVFDYPFEESDAVATDAFKDFGEVKKVKDQTSITDPEVFTGTRLVSLILRTNPPRSLLIGGYLCRVWYKGQPLVCNLCGVQGHKSANCPNKDKCRLCGKSGHFARQCQDAWNRAARAADCAVAPEPEGGLAPAPEGALRARSSSVVGDDADDDEFLDASEGAAIEQFSSSGDRAAVEQSSSSGDHAKIEQFTSSEDSLPSQDLFSGSQSILQGAVFPDASSLRETSVSALDTGASQAGKSASDVAQVAVVSQGGEGGQKDPPPVVEVVAFGVAGESQFSQASSQSSIVSGPSSQVVDDVEAMDSSVCRKRKDRSLAEQGRSFSCEELDNSSKKAFKTPATPGRHSRLPTAVKERPLIKERPSPVRPSALPVRVRDRSSRK